MDAGLGWRRSGRFLGYYSASGIRRALAAYGLWADLQARARGPLVVEIAAEAVGDRLRIRDGEHTFVELVASLRAAQPPMLCIHWLLLQDPRASFPAGRRPLPGQRFPGLGRGREVFELLVLMSTRLGVAALEGVPAWFHTALFFHTRMVFVDPAEEGRFRAILRAGGASGLDPYECSRMLHGGGVADDDGLPIPWNPGPMRLPLKPEAEFRTREWDQRMRREAEERFTFRTG